MSNKRLVFLIVFLVFISFANVFLTSSLIGREKLIPSNFTGGEYAGMIERLMENVKKSYVEEVDMKDLFHGAVRGMIGALEDPNSSFIAPEEYKRLEEDTRGHFGGLGIIIGIREGYLTVISVMEDKPACRAGLEDGELIYSIDGKTTLGMDAEEAAEKLRAGVDPAIVRDRLGISLSEAVNRLRGPVGEPVTVKVGRSEEEARELTIEREQIDMETVSDATVLEDGIGYVRIVNFGETTAGLMDGALEEIKQEGMRALVLDLRNNPGGLLYSAVEVAERFVPGGELIVSIRGRCDESFEKYADDASPFYEFPMVVLVNEYSASGSEIVAAALQDLGRAVIVGEKTYGKGSVQSIVALNDRSAVKLTTSRYHSPADRIIDKVGVEPDVAVELAGDDLEGPAEADEFVKDAQIRKAAEILRAHFILSGIKD